MCIDWRGEILHSHATCYLQACDINVFFAFRFSFLLLHHHHHLVSLSSSSSSSSYFSSPLFSYIIPFSYVVSPILPVPPPLLSPLLLIPFLLSASPHSALYFLLHPLLCSLSFLVFQSSRLHERIRRGQVRDLSEASFSCIRNYIDK